MELPKPPQTNITAKLDALTNAMRTRLEGTDQINIVKEKTRERIKDNTPR